MFHTDIYQVESYEIFEAPSDWEPGDTTPKTFSVTNTGNFDVALRVSFQEVWKNSSGGQISNYDTSNNKSTTINLSENYILKWIPSVESGTTYYYYRTRLFKDETVESLMDSVTYNKNVSTNTNTVCTDNSCTSKITSYAGGTYTLTIKVESIQYDQYKNGWNTNVDIANGPLMPLNIVSGYLDTTGSEVCIESECFYVVGAEDSTHIKLLSKYNLNVGVNPNTNVWEKIQDKSILGYTFVPSDTMYGNVAYTATSYWTDGYNLKPQYGDSYPVYVYDNNADISVYVNQYVDYLNTILNNVQGRLISADELVTLGCSLNDGNCNNAPDWVYKTSYWTGTAYSGYYMKVVGALGQFNTGSWGSENPMYRNDSLGVRPLIIVEKQ